MLEVLKPASNSRIDIGNDSLNTISASPSSLGADYILELPKTLRAHIATARFKAVSEEVKAVTLLKAVANMGLFRA